MYHFVMCLLRANVSTILSSASARESVYKTKSFSVVPLFLYTCISQAYPSKSIRSKSRQSNMHYLVLLPALAGLAASAPAPQFINLDAIDAAPDPVLVSAPFDVTKNIPAAVAPAPITPITVPGTKRHVDDLEKRDGTCAPQPSGAGPVPTPDTVQAFSADPDLAVSRSFLSPDLFIHSRMACREHSLTSLGTRDKRADPRRLRQCLHQPRRLPECFQLYGPIHSRQLRYTHLRLQV